MSFNFQSVVTNLKIRKKNISQKVEKLLSESHGILFCSKSRMALVNSDVG